jgi:hypothetical protein
MANRLTRKTVASPMRSMRGRSGEAGDGGRAGHARWCRKAPVGSDQAAPPALRATFPTTLRVGGRMKALYGKLSRRKISILIRSWDSMSGRLSALAIKTRTALLTSWPGS